MLAALSCVAAGLATLGASLAAGPGLGIHIVYDNTSADGGLREDWGFSAVATVGDRRVLFDSGADADLFLRNLAALGIDPASISHAVISHHHSDHRGGIYRLFQRHPAMRVWFLDSFPAEAFEIGLAVGMNPVRVTGPAEIAPGIHTTGPVGGRIPEQALVIDTAGGPVVLVGCAHPGVDRLVEAAREQRKADSIRLLLGGFHLMRHSEADIVSLAGRLKQLGVRRVAPAHCTGELAKRLLRQEWGENYLACGAGRVINLP